MTKRIITDLTFAHINANEIDPALRAQILTAHQKIHTYKVQDNNVWAELPNIVKDTEISEIQKTAQMIRKNFDILLVLGVGGSYAGAYAGQQWLCNCINGYFPVEYIGTSFDPNSVKAVIEKHGGKKICVNIVSKSGSTLEIIAALNAIQPFVMHTVVTTGAKSGYLHEYALQNKLQSFTILDGVGGRFSFIGAVGYLPLAVAGVDIAAIHAGAKQAYSDLSVAEVEKNEAYKYAIARFVLHRKANKAVEVFASFFDGLEGFGRWWQQLFGESEGKNGKGLFPVPLVYSRDLHSMGQYVQQGAPIFFETILDVVQSPVDVRLDTGKRESMLKVPSGSLAEINRAAVVGTVKAHADAGSPVVILRTDKLDAAGFGYLIYFMEIACAMSAMLLGVNPFDQPGVEFYKKNMRDELK